MRRVVVAALIALASGCSLTIDWPSYSEGGPLLSEAATEAGVDASDDADAAPDALADAGGDADAGDGTVFVTARNGGKLFTTPCDLGQTFVSGTCTGERSLLPYNDGNSHGGVFVGATSDDDGRYDTNRLIGTDSDSDTMGIQKHRAAQACEDLVYAGYDDWYLPSQVELVAMQAAKTTIGNFDPADRYYKSSTESHSAAEPYNAFVVRFSDGYLYADGDTKPQGGLVRCTRFVQ